VKKWLGYPQKNAGIAARRSRKIQITKSETNKSKIQSGNDQKRAAIVDFGI
jgi:hypothetical protein